MEGDHKGGTVVGLILGFIKGLSDANAIGFITWSGLAETIVVTFVGGIFGYLGNEFIKWAKKQIKL